jgi:hypothetical protein
MEIQKTEALSFVESERRKGRVLTEILKNLKASKSSYYRWKRALAEPVASETRTTVRSLTNI